MLQFRQAQLPNRDLLHQALGWGIWTLQQLLHMYRNPQALQLISKMAYMELSILFNVAIHNSKHGRKPLWASCTRLDLLLYIC